MNDKYIAGFTDADGSIGIAASKRADGTFKLSPHLQWSQTNRRSKVLDLLPGNTRVKDSEAGTMITAIRGDEALTFLNRIKKHLVVKRTEADFVLNAVSDIVTEDTLKAIKRSHKAVRKMNSEHGKVQHSRPWAAGYFDGDGCIYSRVRDKKDSYWLETIVNVSSWIYQPEGLDLLHKDWGGNIRSQNNTLSLWVTINPANAQRVLQPLIRHSLLKKEQLILVADRYQSKKHNRAGAPRADLIQFVEELKNLKYTCND